MHLRSRLRLFMLASCCIGLLNGATTSANDDLILIQADRVYTMDGRRLEPGSVLVRGNKIEAVDDEIDATDEMQILKVETLLPGFVDAYSQAGLDSGTVELSREITPELDTLRSLNWRSRRFSESSTAGTTCANIVPGTDNVVAGFSCLVKTAGPRQARVLNERAGVVISVCSDPAFRNRSRSRPDSIFVRQPTNRMGVVWILRSQLQLAGTRRGESQLSKRDSEVNQILCGMLDGQHRVFGVSRTDFDIRSLLRIGDEFGYQPMVFGGDEAYKVADLLAGRGTPVVYTALNTSVGRGAEGTQRRWNVPGMLHKAGVTFCLAGGRLLSQARFAARFGLDRDVALQAVTSIPAKLMRVDGRVGSIASGLDADLVALNGDPFEFTTAVKWVMIDGEVLEN